MYSTQSVRGTWSFSAGDTVVNFANSSRLAIRGHTLVWAQDAFTPDWVKGITDPTELWTATVDHITEVMRHYSGRVRRWDVVNEPLATLGNRTLNERVLVARPELDCRHVQTRSFNRSECGTLDQ